MDARGDGRRRRQGGCSLHHARHSPRHLLWHPIDREENCGPGAEYLSAVSRADHRRNGATRSARIASANRCGPCKLGADREAAAPAALQHRKQELNMSKVWFITGAGSGIGAATARAALKAGDRVVATGRNLDKVRHALRDVAAENLAFVQLDVGNEAQAKPAVDAAIKAFGRIDVLVNNAGYSLLGNFEELSTAEIEKLIATNF